MERYEIIKDIGSGNFGVAKLVREKWSGQLYAVKFIERGFKVLFLTPFSLPFYLICCFILQLFYMNFGLCSIYDVLFNYIWFCRLMSTCKGRL